jgi:hypothetical protein
MEKSFLGFFWCVLRYSFELTFRLFGLKCSLYILCKGRSIKKPPRFLKPLRFRTQFLKTFSTGFPRSRDRRTDMLFFHHRRFYRKLFGIVYFVGLAKRNLA